jgi:hypothetical protein
VRVLLLSVFAVVCVVALRLAADHMPRPARSKATTATAPATTKPGARYHVTRGDGSGKTVLLARTLADMDRMLVLSNAGDSLGGVEMLERGRLFEVADKTEVLPIQEARLRGVTVQELRVLEGEHAGRSGYALSGVAVER